MSLRTLSLLRAALLAGAALWAASGPAMAQGALEKVTLQLKGKHQFQFSGYYTALDKGYYRHAGFDVAIQEAQEADGPGGPIDAVLSGKADYGVASSELALRRGLGDPVVVLATIMQQSAMAATGAGMPRAPEARRTVMPPREARTDFYGDTLFTSEGRVRASRERVQAFRDASVRGWQYAMAHPEEITGLILSKYGGRMTREHLMVEAAEMRNLMQPDLIEIGHSNPGRWRHIAGVYAESGLLPPDYSMDGFMLDAANSAQAAGVPWWLSGAVLLAVLAGLYGARRVWLGHVPADGSRRVAPGRAAAGNTVPGSLAPAMPGTATPPLRDPVTGLHNGAFLHEALAHELLRAMHDNAPLSVVLVELENLHQLQETEGQSAANALLASLAGLLRESAGNLDLTGRLHGPLFAWVLPGVSADEAGRRAEALRSGFANARAWAGLIEVSGTVACTVRSDPTHAADADALLAPP